MATIFDDLLNAFRCYLLRVDAAIVRDFVGDLGWEMPERKLHANSLACLRHLSHAVELASPDERELTMRLAHQAGALRWGQTYTEADFGRHFIDNYGWMELFGTRGHFRNERIAAGFLILGPGIVYPDHHHIADEVYIPLTGAAEWRMGDGDFRRRRGGEVIHHASSVNHAMRTGREPLLALYLWRGGDLAQKSSFTGAIGGEAR